jgi:S-adenosyl methyltransferase
VPPGSYLGISIPASDIQPEAQVEMIRRLAREVPVVTIAFGSHAEVTRLFDGLELLEPGVVPVNRWRPGQAAATRQANCRTQAVIARAAPSQDGERRPRTVSSDRCGAGPHREPSYARPPAGSRTCLIPADPSSTAW